MNKKIVLITMCCMPFLLFSSHVSVHAVRQIVEKILQNNPSLANQASLYSTAAKEGPDVPDVVTHKTMVRYIKNEDLRKTFIRALHALITTHGIMNVPKIAQYNKSFPHFFALSSIINLIVLQITKELFKR